MQSPLNFKIFVPLYPGFQTQIITNPHFEKKELRLREKKEDKKCLNVTLNCNCNYNLRVFDDEPICTSTTAGRICV